MTLVTLYEHLPHWRECLLTGFDLYVRNIRAECLKVGRPGSQGDLGRARVNFDPTSRTQSSEVAKRILVRDSEGHVRSMKLNVY